MPVTTLFGIPITDRASRLIAADCAEERGLGELAAALHQLGQPIVLESTDPPVLLPELTMWVNRKSAPEFPPQFREATGLLLRLLHGQAMVQVVLRFVSANLDMFDVATTWDRCNIDLFELWILGSIAPTRPEAFRVMPGRMVVGRTRSYPDFFTFFVAHDDAPRFGFGYVPAFPGE